MLPGESGFEVFAALRQERLNLPVILLSGDDSPETLGAVAHLEPIDYMVKLISFAELSGRIHRLLGESSNEA
jgi:DNA-binding response OmpR family regulator